MVNAEEEKQSTHSSISASLDERFQSALLCIGYTIVHYTVFAVITDAVEHSRGGREGRISSAWFLRLLKVLRILRLLNVFLPPLGIFLLRKTQKANKRIPRGCEPCGCNCKYPFLPVALAACALASLVQAILDTRDLIDACDVASVIANYVSVVLLGTLSAFWFCSRIAQSRSSSQEELAAV
mmetsp:Transcript_6259/g.14823  ORF Transcript_6259/g.14823 Transcript_6259/m.14823 type:complete len:182 (-) Transcript_6259:171-716(-)|eukprot:CAMPEP_0171059510 /NCGR_PEP_ID=MMETSP0766_2-20121228/3217_1 /TAXON_ID=439317 /ORGANISM="Gambierdiscus australes, Strain CAWD 149" /LENGTH=181 /DNA_ID=CAMNT_0011514955 /DNA_START=85 /DNA_END=630 /DNA_ORIENTATION=+